MKKDALLSIRSTQRFEGCDEEKIDLITQARFYKRGGKFYISYEESELTGLLGTRTTVKIDGDTVTMMRTGTYPSEMIFGKKSTSCRTLSHRIWCDDYLNTYKSA